MFSQVRGAVIFHVWAYREALVSGSVSTSTSCPSTSCQMGVHVRDNRDMKRSQNTLFSVDKGFLHWNLKAGVYQGLRARQVSATRVYA